MIGIEQESNEIYENYTGTSVTGKSYQVIFSHIHLLVNDSLVKWKVPT